MESAIRLLRPWCKFRKHILDGQRHAAHQQTAAQSLPEGGHSLALMQMDNHRYQGDWHQVISEHLDTSDYNITIR